MMFHKNVHVHSLLFWVVDRAKQVRTSYLCTILGRKGKPSESSSGTERELPHLFEFVHSPTCRNDQTKQSGVAIVLRWKLFSPRRNQRYLKCKQMSQSPLGAWKAVSCLLMFVCQYFPLDLQIQRKKSERKDKCSQDVFSEGIFAHLACPVSWCQLSPED